MNLMIQANPVFKEVDSSRKRYIVMKGSAGSGKSVDTAQNYILRLMRDKGRNLVCIRKSDSLPERYIVCSATGRINTGLLNKVRYSLCFVTEIR